MARKASQPDSAADGLDDLGVLSPKQEQVAVLMASGVGQGLAAKQADVGERTVRTWVATCPEFRQRIAELRGELTERAMGRLASHMTLAADTLARLCTKGKSDQAKLLAARAILELGVKLRESVELANELAELRARVDGEGKE